MIPQSTDAPANDEAIPAIVPRCRRCWHMLLGLGTMADCPECGEPFDLRVAESFIEEPPFDRLRFWWRGVVVATIVFGVVRLVEPVSGRSGNIIAGLSAGCMLLGYRLRYSGWMGGLLIAMVAISSGYIYLIAKAGLLGFLGGLVIAGCYAMLPVLCFLVGVITRQLVKRARVEQSGYLP